MAVQVRSCLGLLCPKRLRGAVSKPCRFWHEMSHDYWEALSACCTIASACGWHWQVAAATSIQDANQMSSHESASHGTAAVQPNTEHLVSVDRKQNGRVKFTEFVSAWSQLTEEGTEYSVTAIKHILDAHIVFQFDCSNTVAEQILENVSVAMDLSEAVSILR